ncbi:hypothetical protein HPP92_007136 [Vanilla planifolia]|uniref:Uncharacterized protein n=1 Tax=Vanilla planifolia TaxID=51239 RepID=A0A835RDR9_VANPL|nr:hypothetical protein HPP92_007374 [Vanilla planifolia]KAG0490273.1 hypothetical protein HPP92_007136 [Vanilla planifolia]
MEELLHEWAVNNISTVFFKCTRWQVEETADLLNCPFHYFCDSWYAGNYPPIVDLSVLLVAVGSFLSAAAFTVLEFKGCGESFGPRNFKRRYFLPSGPVVLPLMLVALANGQKIDTLFPLSQVGPSLLLLIYVSALAFENKADRRNTRVAVLEASTVSGILHASLYLDSIVLPYYTGLDALASSVFSGECPMCVCRKEDLVAGGRLVSYRGCSKTMLAIVAALFSRMVCRIIGEGMSALLLKLLLEAIGWLYAAADAVYLMIIVPQGSHVLGTMAYGLVCALILSNVFRRLYGLCRWLEARRHMERKEDIGFIVLEIV